MNVRTPDHLAPSRAVALMVILGVAMLVALPAPAMAAYVVDYRGILLDGAKWGYLDTAGRVVIEPKFDEAKAFSEGRAAVRVGEKWGYIDVAGQLVIPAEFGAAEPFAQGLAAVAVAAGESTREKKRAGKSQDLRWGYVDPAGAIVVPPTYQAAGAFGCGRGLVKEGDRFGYVGHDGKPAIEPRFEWACGFSEGLAAVQVGEKWGYIDTAGTIVIEPQFKTAMADGFQGGLAAVEVEAAFGDRWGFIDRSGKLAIAAEYDYVNSFCEGLAMVKNGDKHGFIDPTGRVVVPVKYWGASPFSEGLARVEEKNDETGHWGYIDLAGRPAFSNKRLYAPLRNGRILAQVFHKDQQDERPMGSWGFHDAAGRPVIPATLEWAEGFSEGLAPFATGANHAAVKRAQDAERGTPADVPGL